MSLAKQSEVSEDSELNEFTVLVRDILRITRDAKPEEFRSTVVSPVDLRRLRGFLKEVALAKMQDEWRAPKK